MSKLTVKEAAQLVAAAGSGAGFGFCIQKGAVYLPAVIVGQMQMRDFSMLLMFLSAVTTSAGVHIVAGLLNPKVVAQCRAKNEHCRPLTSVAAGAALLGAGMAVAGACPGTVIVQVATGVHNAGFVLLGAMCGALVYAQAVHDRVPSCTVPASKQHVDELAGVPLPAAQVALMGMLSVVIYAVNALGNGGAPLHAPSLGAARWHPVLAGIGVGLVQLPAILLVNRSIGSSSSYVAVLANCAPMLKSKYLTKYRGLTFANLWQPAYLLGAVAGAATAAAYGGIAYGSQGAAASTLLLTPVRAFAGGFLLLMGARLAGGCTSGHGISGFSQLMASSFVAVPAMFGAGIATALAMQAMK